MNVRALVLLLLFAGVTAHAQQTCYRYSLAASAFNGTNLPAQGPGTNVQSMCVAFMAPCTGSGTCGITASESRVAGVTVVDNFPDYNCTAHKVNNTTGVQGILKQTNFIRQTNPSGCSTCPAVGQIAYFGTSSPAAWDVADGSAMCVSGCEYLYTKSRLEIDVCAGVGDAYSSTQACPGSRRVLAFGSSLGRACGSASGGGQVVNGDEYSLINADCIGQGADTVCRTSDGECGTFNGNTVCPGRMQEGCYAFVDGAVTCFDGELGQASGGGVTAPPAPDSGTPGVVAQPDMVVSRNGRQAWYWDDETVSNSSTPPVTSPYTPGTGEPVGPGSGSGGGGTIVCEDDDPANCVTVEVDVMGECPVGEDCTVAGEVEGLGTRLDEIEVGAEREPCQTSFAACVEEFRQNMADTPIITAVTNLATLPISSTPQCPSFQVTLFGQQQDFATSLCALFEDQWGFLATLSLIAWSMIAIRIAVL